MATNTLQYRIYWCNRVNGVPFLAYCELAYCSWLETQPHFNSWATDVLTVTQEIPES